MRRASIIVGAFPGMAWAEWNGRYRDVIRRFVRGDPGLVGQVATCVAGSADLYQDDGRLPANSINFVTCHDGFTLSDLVSYNAKHNEANGEDNRDGSNDNLSWNCGAEGETDDAQIMGLRHRQARNFMAILLLSQGVPMILAGDEFLRTQHGNNNAFCQDNALSWIDWRLSERASEMLRFTREFIALRKRHASLRHRRFLTGRPSSGQPHPDVAWHGERLHAPEWNDPGGRLLAFTLAGEIARRAAAACGVQYGRCRARGGASRPGRRAALATHRRYGSRSASRYRAASQGRERRKRNMFRAGAQCCRSRRGVNLPFRNAEPVGSRHDVNLTHPCQAAADSARAAPSALASKSIPSKAPHTPPGTGSPNSPPPSPRRRSARSGRCRAGCGIGWPGPPGRARTPRPVSMRFEQPHQLEGAALARRALAARTLREEAHVLGHLADDAGALRNDDHRPGAEARMAVRAPSRSRAARRGRAGSAGCWTGRR